MTKPSITQNIQQVVQSVLAAFIGVQSNAKREQDFHQGSLKIYIIAGLIFTVLFVGLVLTIVSLVLG